MADIFLPEKKKKGPLITPVPMDKIVIDPATGTAKPKPVVPSLVPNTPAVSPVREDEDENVQPLPKSPSQQTMDALKFKPSEVKVDPKNVFNKVGTMMAYGTPAGFFDMAMDATVGPDTGPRLRNIMTDVAVGTSSAVEETYNFIAGLTGLPESDWVRKNTPEATNMLHEMVRGGVQFALPYGAVAKGLTWGAKLIKGAGELSKVWKYGVGALGGAGVDFVAFNPNDENLANFMRDHFEIGKPIYEFLASNPDDPESLNRLRNSIIGLGFGAAVETIVQGVQHGFTAIAKPIQKSLSLDKVTAEAFDRAAQKIKFHEKPTMHEWMEEYTKAPSIAYKWNRAVQLIADETLGAKMFDKMRKEVIGGDYDNVLNFRVNVNHVASLVDRFFNKGTLKVLRHNAQKNPVDGKWDIVDHKGNVVERTQTQEQAEIALRKKNNAIEYEYDGGRGLNEIIKPVLDAGHERPFMMYWLGRRLQALKKENPKFESEWSDDEIEAMVKNGEMSSFLDDTVRYSYDDFIAPINKWNDSLLKFAHDAELLSDDGMKFLKERGIYLPLQRHMPDEHTPIPGRSHTTGGSTGGLSRRFKKEKDGGPKGAKTELQLEDPLSSVIANASSILQAAVKNMARLGIYNDIDHMAVTNPEVAALFATKETKIPEFINKSKKELASMLHNSGVDIDPGLVPDEIIQIFNRKRFAQGNDVDVVFRKGKAVAYQLNGNGEGRFLMDTIGMLGPRPVLGPLKWMITSGSKFKRLLTNATTLNPKYVVRNMFRDTVQAAILSENKFYPFISTIKGVVDRWTHDKDYQDAFANGLGFHGVFHEGVEAERNRLDAFYRGKGIDPSKVVSPANIFELLRTVAEIGETGTRMAEYRKSRAAGKTRQQSTYDALEVSTDFSLHGSSQFVRVLTATVPFLNAGIQGMYKMYRMGLSKKTAARMALRFGMALVPISLVNWWFGKDSKKIKDQPDWVRDTHWVIDPSMFGQDVVDALPEPLKDLIMIPKPFELGGLVSMIERMAQYTYDNYSAAQKGQENMDRDWSDLPDDILRILGDQFRLNTVPQFIDPILDLAQNKSDTGAPIVPPTKEKLSPEFQVSPNTSGILTDIGQNTGLSKITGVSPIELQYLWDNYFGAIGSTILSFADHVYRNTDEKGRPPDLRWDEIPVIDVFIRNEPFRTTRYQYEFFDIYKGVQQTFNTYNSLVGTKGVLLQDSELSRQYYSNPHNIIATEALYPFMNKIVQTVSNLDTMMQKDMSDPHLSPEQKLKRMELVYGQRNQLYEMAMKTIRTTPAYRFALDNMHFYKLPE